MFVLSEWRPLHLLQATVRVKPGHYAEATICFISSVAAAIPRLVSV
jgi:hypothetical protein